MYQIIIDKTAKRAGNKDHFTRYDREVKEVKTIEDVENYLFGNAHNGYNKKTRIPMYKDNEAVKVGYIYRYKASECSRETGKWETFFYQDWVEVNELQKTSVLL